MISLASTMHKDQESWRVKPFTMIAGKFANPPKLW